MIEILLFSNFYCAVEASRPGSEDRYHQPKTLDTCTQRARVNLQRRYYLALRSFVKEPVNLECSKFGP